jgi:hypothetical protein
LFADPFDEPRALIRRARKHIEELAREQDAYSTADPLELVKELRASDGWTVCKVRLRHQPAPDNASIVFDVATGLRSSLDIAVSAATRVASGGSADLKSSAFIIASTPEIWEQQLKSRAKAVPPAIVEAMRHLKPWPGGDSLLVLLNDLANTRKHRILVPVAYAPGGYAMSGVNMTSPLRVGGHWNPDRQEIVLYEHAPEGSVSFEHLHLEAQFCLPADDRLIPAVRALADIAARCDFVVEYFATLMGRPSPRVGS